MSWLESSHLTVLSKSITLSALKRYIQSTWMILTLMVSKYLIYFRVVFLEILHFYSHKKFHCLPRISKKVHMTESFRKLNWIKMLLVELDTAKNTVISPDFLVWKFCGKVQFPYCFGRFARNYKTIRKRCLSAKYPHQKIRWNCGIFRSECF